MLYFSAIQICFPYAKRKVLLIMYSNIQVCMFRPGYVIFEKIIEKKLRLEDMFCACAYITSSVYGLASLIRPCGLCAESSINFQIVHSCWAYSQSVVIVWMIEHIDLDGCPWGLSIFTSILSFRFYFIVYSSEQEEAVYTRVFAVSFEETFKVLVFFPYMVHYYTKE